MSAGRVRVVGSQATDVHVTERRTGTVKVVGKAKEGPQGATGPQGPPGQDGRNGINGVDGANGQPRFYGNGPPPTVIQGAVPGDEYLDEISGNVYRLT